MRLIPERSGTYLKRFFIFLLRLFFPPPTPTRGLPGKADRILVVRQHDQMGDMLCVTPLLRAIRERVPESAITLIASPVSVKIMLNHPYLAAVWNYDKRRYWRAPGELLRFIRMIRQKKFDIVVVPGTVSVSFTSDLIAFLSSAPLRIGVKSLNGLENPGSSCYTDPVDLDWRGEPHRHMSLRNLDILRPFGISTGNLLPAIGLTEQEEHEAQGFIRPLRGKHRFLIGFHPGAGKRENRWPAERFASVTNRVCREHGAFALISKGPMDDEPVGRMLRDCTCGYSILTSPLRPTAAIFDQLDLIVTNDTGIMHVAGSLRTRMIALFGPTDPLQWAPSGEQNRYIRSEDGNIFSIQETEVYELMERCLEEKQNG